MCIEIIHSNLRSICLISIYTWASRCLCLVIFISSSSQWVYSSKGEQTIFSHKHWIFFSVQPEPLPSIISLSIMCAYGRELRPPIPNVLSKYRFFQGRTQDFDGGFQHISATGKNGVGGKRWCRKNYGSASTGVFGYKMNTK